MSTFAPAIAGYDIQTPAGIVMVRPIDDKTMHVKVMHNLIPPPPGLKARKGFRAKITRTNEQEQIYRTYLRQLSPDMALAMYRAYSDPMNPNHGLARRSLAIIEQGREL